MTKINESQENNLNPHILPFYEAWKSTLLAKAALYGVPLDHDKNNIKSIYDTIKAYENEQIELSQRTIEPFNNNHLGEYEKYIIEKAIAYHIPIAINNLDINKLCYEIEDYELLLDSADNAKIDWDTSIYDPEGLESAVAEVNWNFEQQYWDYRNGVIGIYNAGRGV